MFKTGFSQVSLMLGALLLGRTTLDKFPDMLAAQLTGRLLPFIAECPLIRSDLDFLMGSSSSIFLVGIVYSLHISPSLLILSCT